MQPLKDQVARGVAWSMAEKIGSMLLTMAVRLVILRLLLPDDYGIMALLTAFAAVSLVVVDSGFSQTLIRKSEPTPTDYKSVFVFNLTLATALYGVLVVVSPFVADYYRMPILNELAPVFFLLLPLNTLGVNQNTILTRQFRFALLSKVTFFSSLIAGLTAVVLALSGFGVWCLVAERLTQVGVRTAMLWWLSDWRPRGRFSAGALRQMAPFSMSLMATDLITTFYNKVPQFFFGKLYTSSQLGSFEQAVKLKDMPAVSAVQAVQAVTFPALSRIQEDAPKFAESFRQILLVVSYVMFPVMLGLSAVGEDLFAAFLGENWMPTVPYFRVICLAGLFYPIAMIAYNVLKVYSGGALLVKIEVVKKILMTVIFAATIPFSIQAVVWGLVAISLTEMIVNFGATRRFTLLTWGGLVRLLLPVVGISGAMYAACLLVGLAMPASGDLLRLAVKVLCGGVCYLALSALFRLEAFRILCEIVRKQFNR